MNLFPTEEARRSAARGIARVTGPSLALFSLGDDHGHVELGCERERLATLRSALTRGLRRVAADELAPSFALEVETRSHLSRNVRYFLTQAWHHGLAFHPALDAGCCFQDLVGARRLPGFDPRVLKRALPRLDRAELSTIVGLPAGALEPVPLDELGKLGAHRIADAVASALGVGPRLIGRTEDVVIARRATVRLGDLGGVSRRDLRDALGASRRTLCRLASEPVDPSLLGAIRRRLSIERAVEAEAIAARLRSV